MDSTVVSASLSLVDRCGNMLSFYIDICYICVGKLRHGTNGCHAKTAKPYRKQMFTLSVLCLGVLKSETTSNLLDFVGRASRESPIVG